MDKQFKNEDRKVALIIDNCTAHPKLIFLIYHQILMDQSVILAINATYCIRVVRRMINYIDKNIKPLPLISILEALKILVFSRNDLSKVMVKSCI